MRLLLPFIFCAVALPAVAQTELPQIEADGDFPVWGSPDDRRAFFEAEKAKIAAEQARLEAERKALAEAEAAKVAAAEAARVAAAELRRSTTRRVYPSYGGYGADHVWVCSDARPHPGATGTATGPKSGANGTVLLRRSTKAEDCRWVLRQKKRRTNGLVLQFGPDGVQGTLRLGDPWGYD